MNKSIIETVVLDQQEELDQKRQQRFVERSEEALINLESRLAQIVVGVRRSGKSTLCFNALERSGVNYAYVNFDDERFAGLTAMDLDSVLEILYRVYGKFTHLFLDEIQNVDGWPLFVNRLLRQGVHLVVTGSNAKLLSHELATHLTGRHLQIELYPFSFRDWCSAKAIPYDRPSTLQRGLLGQAFDEYLHTGGFPELLEEKNSRAYIDTLFHNILVQDIQRRFNVKNISELVVIAEHILNEVPDRFSVDALMELSGIKSNHTVAKYLSYLTQTYLVTPVKKYSNKSSRRTCCDKYYPIDVAFMDKRANAFAGPNLGWRLETIVFLELKRRCARRGLDVYYAKGQGWEADFVVCDGRKAVAVYQVSYDISNPVTQRRELRGCVSAAKATGCDNIFLITKFDRDEIVMDGKTIKVVAASDWLLADDWGNCGGF